MARPNENRPTDLTLLAPLAEAARLFQSPLTAPEPDRRAARADWPVVVAELAPDVANEDEDYCRAGHQPPHEVDGRYVSECCTAYGYGEVDAGDPKLGILPTGICGACHDHAVFARECAHCHEIVEMPR